MPLSGVNDVFLFLVVRFFDFLVPSFTMSVRRTLSVHEHGLQNGVPFSLSENSLQVLPPVALQRSNACATSVNSSSQSKSTLFSAVLPFSRLKVSHHPGTWERSKFKGSTLTKPFLQLLLCFSLGFGLGLAPFKQFDLMKHTSFSRGVKLERTKNSAQDWRDLGKSLHPKVNHNGEEQKSFVKNIQDLQSSEDQPIRPDEVGKLPETGIPETLNDRNNWTDRKLLIVVTPTYPRPFQAFYMTRLAHTLKLVPSPLLWLVVEAPVQSLETAALLRNTGVMYRHLVCTKESPNLKDRGTHQRNTALNHIEQHQLDGIVYFADDDNVYSLELFEQLRAIKRFGTWPVGMLAHSKSKTILEGPVCEGNTVIGWHTNEKSKRLRRFHVDMSGFGFNSSILWNPRTWHHPVQNQIQQLDTIKEGFQETTFIEQLVEDESQMEGLPYGCSKIMVWHLHLELQGSSYPSAWNLKNYLDPNTY